jgi:hypothetical protein
MLIDLRLRFELGMLKLLYKRLKKKELPYNFREFWSEKFHCKKYPEREA